jgi:hypothetical protein
MNTGNNFIKTALLGTFSNSTVQSIKTATISINDTNGNSSSRLITNGILLNLNKIGSNLPLNNVTTIKSSSFRNNKNYAKSDLSKSIINSSLLGTSTNSGNNNNTNSSYHHHNVMTHSRTNSRDINSLSHNKRELSKEFDYKNESKLDEMSTPSTSTKQSIHRLVKIATNWNPNKESSAVNTKFIERSLISQSKIRKTQMFLNDEHEYVNEESCLSRKLAEVNDKLNRVKLSDDTSSDKNLKLQNRVNRTPVIPVVKRYLDYSSSETSSKADLNYWNSNDAMLVNSSEDYLSKRLTTNDVFTKNNQSNNNSSRVKRVSPKTNPSQLKLTHQVSIEI